MENEERSATAGRSFSFLSRAGRFAKHLESVYKKANQRLSFPDSTVDSWKRYRIRGIVQGERRKKMNQSKTGTFIAMRRKEKKLTQAQLAEKLNITDRAVSKWETGKSMPDSSIMLELCEILGITVNELLSGEKVEMENVEKKADENLIALKRKDENNMTRNVLIAVLFSMMLFVGIMVCLICDLAISGHVTWSLIPVSSIVFSWLILFPGILLGKRGGCDVRRFVKRLFASLLVFAGQFGEGEGSVFDRGKDRGGVYRVFVDHYHYFWPCQKEAGGFRSRFFDGRSVFICCQYDTVKNDSGTVL